MLLAKRSTFSPSFTFKEVYIWYSITKVLSIYNYVQYYVRWLWTKCSSWHQVFKNDSASLKLKKEIENDGSFDKSDFLSGWDKRFINHIIASVHFNDWLCLQSNSFLHYIDVKVLSILWPRFYTWKLSGNNCHGQGVVSFSLVFWNSICLKLKWQEALLKKNHFLLLGN